jgi:two-component system OmpR family response regulator
MRVLVVEDDPKLGTLLEQGLGEDGFGITWARDGEAGLALALADEFDVILLDYMLPKKNGHELTVELRAAGRRTPILMLTARDAPDDLRRALAAGVNQVMSKPFRFADLTDRLRALAAEPVR